MTRTLAPAAVAALTFLAACAGDPPRPRTATALGFDRGLPDSQTSWQRRLAVVGGSALAVITALTVVGGITSIFYYRAFGITGSFQDESWVNWPLWGLRALLAPVILAGGVAAAGHVFLGRVFRFILAIRFAKPLTQPIADGVRRGIERFGGADTTTVSSMLLLAQCALLLITVWWFASTFNSFDSLIMQRPADLAPLSPANIGEQVQLRQLFSLELLVTTVAWVSLLRRRSRASLREGWIGIAGGATVTVFMLILLLVPYRIVWHNEHERVTYRQQHCYLLGERAGEALLFCPIESPPRNRVVRLDDAGLERGGPEENMFAPLDSSVKQSGGER
jgi:hypothetical protein